MGEESVRTDHQQPCRNCHAGREEGSLWQSGDGQSKASKKSGEGISCLCLEAERMRWMESKRCYTCTCGVSHMQHVVRLGEHLYLLDNLIDEHQRKKKKV